MLWRMLRQSWGRNLRRKVLAIITVFLASSLISALLAVSIDIGDKMSRELKSYGANILIEPAGQAALPALFSESSNPLSGQDFLDSHYPGRYDLVFLDIYMDGINGMDTARKIRQRGGRTSADSGHFLQSASGYS